MVWFYLTLYLVKIAFSYQYRFAERIFRALSWCWARRPRLQTKRRSLATQEAWTARHQWRELDAVIRI